MEVHGESWGSRDIRTCLECISTSHVDLPDFSQIDSLSICLRCFQFNMEPDLTNSSSEAVSPHFPPPKRTLPLPEGQPNRKKPVLMQRPQSSGIDVTGFSFARPANQPKGFTLKPIPRLTHHGRASLEEVSAADSQKHTRCEKEV